MTAESFLSVIALFKKTSVLSSDGFVLLCMSHGWIFLWEQTVVKHYHHAAFPVAFTTAEAYVLQPLGCSNRRCAAAGHLNALLSI